MKRSIIWKVPKKDLVTLIKKCETFRDVLRSFGYHNRSGGAWKTLKQRLEHDKIDFSHLKISKARFNRVKDSELFRIQSPHSRNALRKRILDNNLIPYRCAICGLNPKWNNKPLTLFLDHINGTNDDHRLENLRFLCPNCDSQTETYGGRNIKHAKRKCIRCGNDIWSNSKTGLCSSCYRHPSKRPDRETLAKLVWEFPATKIAKTFGVSDKAVAKWCKKYGISKPGPGYWSKNGA